MLVKAKAPLSLDLCAGRLVNHVLARLCTLHIFAKKQSYLYRKISHYATASIKQYLEWQNQVGWIWPWEDSSQAYHAQTMSNYRRLLRAIVGQDLKISRFHWRQPLWACCFRVWPPSQWKLTSFYQVRISHIPVCVCSLYIFWCALLKGAWLHFLFPLFDSYRQQ